MRRACQVPDLRIGPGKDIAAGRQRRQMSNVERSASLGQSVRQRRLAAGLTQSELAESADVADATLSRIERDRLEPSIGLVRRIADALGVTTDDLLSGPKTAKKPALRQCEARLLGAVRGLDDACVDDIAKGVRLILSVGRRSAGKSTQLGTRGRG